MTRYFTWAIANDEANRNMRKNGRTSWNEEDVAVGARVFEKIWPLENDLPRLREEER